MSSNSSAVNVRGPGLRYPAGTASFPDPFPTNAALTAVSDSLNARAPQKWTVSGTAPPAASGDWWERSGDGALFRHNGTRWLSPGHFFLLGGNPGTPAGDEYAKWGGADFVSNKVTKALEFQEGVYIDQVTIKSILVPDSGELVRFWIGSASSLDVTWDGAASVITAQPSLVVPAGDAFTAQYINVGGGGAVTAQDWQVMVRCREYV